MLVLCDLAVAENVLGPSLPVIWEIQDVEHVRLLLLDHLPAEINDALEPQGLVVLFPAVTNEYRVRLREGDKLELYGCQRSD